MSVNSLMNTITEAGPRVLVVEDGETNRMIAQAMLQRAGYDVTCAYDGAEAVTMVLTGDFEAVLMDLAMPVMDGVEATKSIRQLPEPLCHTPIVALTAYDSQQDRARCVSAGMDDYLAKPLRAERLLSVLESVREKSELHRTGKAPHSGLSQEEFDHREKAIANDVRTSRQPDVLVAEDTLKELISDAGEAAFERLIKEFLSEAKELADSLARAKREWEFDRHQRMAHSLKSSSSAFGATALEAAAAGLEQACMESDMDAADTHASKLPLLFVATSKELEQRGYIKS